MKALLIASIVLVASQFSGCATTQKFNRLAIGMTKAQAIGVLGAPDAVSAQDVREILAYDEYASHDDAMFNNKTRILVLLTDGKVTRYGRQDEIFPPSPEEREARARAAEASRQMMQNYMMYRAAQQQAPAYSPPVYQAPRPTNTSCRTFMLNGMAQTDCTSQQTGIDTSIYNH